jgi:flagellar basal body rod protein FlgG
MESLDLLANNLANSSTNGFKSDGEFYTLIRAELPLIEKRWTDFTQGRVIPTGNALDLALEGPGFFALNAPTGVVYTRNGSFQISGARQLVTAEGYSLRNLRDGGRPITVDPQRPIEIDASGVVRQGGQEVGQLELAGFEAPSDALAKLGSSYFARWGEAGPASPARAVVRQGAIEQSNVAPAEVAVRLVSVMRQFEMLQRAMTVGAEMNKRAAEELARTS